MTKAERLMFLVTMIRNRGVVLVREMADECDVSPRTIYRDMKSLLKLNIPLYYENGYRMARDIEFPFGGFDPEDMEFICYSLRNNPLSKHPFFTRKFRVMEQKIQVRLTRRQRAGQESLFLFEKKSHLIEKNRESDIIAKFLRAINERRKIAVSLEVGDIGGRACTPLAVKLRQSEPYLLLATEAKLVVEEPISNITSIKLTDERFTQRPLYLLRHDLPSQKKVDDM